ncbi:hybrid sensor histidine kinase/response regulator [bacterium]|nr:hybrid sensor histidine kinase/response regulator [bacterium]
MGKGFDKSAFIGRFTAETTEHLARLEEGLLLLEKRAHDEALLDNMMREAHTLKGSAAMMGFIAVGTQAHELEDVLSGIRRGETAADDVDLDALLGMLDTIRSLLDAGPGEGKATFVSKPVGSPKDDRSTGVAGSAAPAAEVGQPATPIESPGSAAAAGGAPHPAAPTVRSCGMKPARAEKATEHGGAGATCSEDAVEFVRVDVRKLDRLMNQVGELAGGKTRVDQCRTDMEQIVSAVQELDSLLAEGGESPDIRERVTAVRRDLTNAVEALGRTADAVGSTTSQLQDAVMSARMLPAAVVFAKFPRAVRDLAREEGKCVEFNMTGDETELDKRILEKIHDPLVHILRNAVGHGIESPDERRRLGKDETGSVVLRARCEGSQIIIEVEDDGSGVDIDGLRQAALAKGIVGGERLWRMSEEAVLDLLFERGLSTAAEVSELSGRGVGLDVVRKDIGELGGRVDVTSKLGRGTKFTIWLPLSLVVSTALVVAAGDARYALPLDSVVETLRLPAGGIKRVGGREAITVRDEIVPLVSLRTALWAVSSDGIEQRRSVCIAIVGFADKKLAILVDAFAGKLDIVAKGLGDHLESVPYIAAATVTGAGEVLPILDIPALISGALCRQERRRSIPVVQEASKISVLVVEDSPMTRDLECSVLESADYSVGVAANGSEALRKLAEGTFSLVVTDIAMPAMSGIELMELMKKDERLSSIPVVVVSSRDTDEDKVKGLRAGASAYIGKRHFDQDQLLGTVERLIG